MGRAPRSMEVFTGRTVSLGLTIVPVIALVAGPSACSGGDDPMAVNVYAASSLADVMELVEERYEADNPGLDLRLNLAGTNALVRQINSGADAAILVAADASFVDDLIDAPVVTSSVLATNELTLVVPSDNPAQISGPEDLSADGVLTARCATGVPCGDATDRYLAANDYAVSRATEEANVRSVLAKVSAGEVDAGFVYRTDAAATDAVVAITLGDAPRVTITMARLADDDVAADLAAYLESADVGELFDQLGFGPPVATGAEGG